MSVVYNIDSKIKIKGNVIVMITKKAVDYKINENVIVMITEKAVDYEIKMKEYFIVIIIENQ